jgi:Protein of function (DUF2518)
MPTPENFLTYTQWSGIATLALAGLAILAFIFKWGFRFRLVGATGFMGVLTVGLVSLTFVPLAQIVIPNSAKYSLVYDTGAADIVIAVAPDITQPQLEATLEQAAINLFSPGRLGRGNTQLRVRARTVIHPEEGASVPLYLGEARRSLATRANETLEISVFEQNMARLPQAAQAS